jgi:hypothetical protein
MLVRSIFAVISIAICLDVFLPEESCRALMPCEDCDFLTSDLSDLDEETEVITPALAVAPRLRIGHSDYLHVPSRTGFIGICLELARAPPALA